MSSVRFCAAGVWFGWGKLGSAAPEVSESVSAAQELGSAGRKLGSAPQGFGSAEESKVRPLRS